MLNFQKNIADILSYDDYSLVKLPNLLLINMCQVKSQSSGLPMKEWKIRFIYLKQIYEAQH